MRGNILGIVMLVASAPMAALGSLIFKWPNPMTMSCVGLALIIMDLAFRFRLRASAGWLTKRELGGFVYFLPIWGAGVVVIAANVVNGVFGPLGK